MYEKAKCKSVRENQCEISVHSNGNKQINELEQKIDQKQWNT